MTVSLLSAVCWILFTWGSLPLWGIWGPVLLFCILGVAAWRCKREHTHHADDVDRWARRSRLGTVAPEIKCAAALVIIFGVLLCRSLWAAAFVIITMCLFTVWIGGVPLKVWLHLLQTPMAFLLLGGAALLIEVSPAAAGEPCLPVGGVYLCVTQQARQETAVVLAGAAAAVSCLLALALSTPLYECIEVLRKAKVPGLVSELMFFIYRYLFVLEGCLQEQKTAAAARMGFWGVRSTMRTTGGMMLTLLVGSMRRASDSFDAMESRCYEGELRYLHLPAAVQPAHVWLTLAYLAAMLLTVCLERMWLLHGR